MSEQDEHGFETTRVRQGVGPDGQLRVLVVTHFQTHVTERGSALTYWAQAPHAFVDPGNACEYMEKSARTTWEGNLKRYPDLSEPVWDRGDHHSGRISMTVPEPSGGEMVLQWTFSQVEVRDAQMVTLEGANLH